MKVLRPSHDITAHLSLQLRQSQRVEHRLRLALVIQQRGQSQLKQLETLTWACTLDIISGMASLESDGQAAAAAFLQFLLLLFLFSLFPAFLPLTSHNSSCSIVLHMMNKAHVLASHMWCSGLLVPLWAWQPGSQLFVLSSTVSGFDRVSVNT